MTSSAEAVTRWSLGPSGSLDEAYDVCEAITRHHSKSFYFASAMLPVQKRRAIRALYAFCRWSDDIVDEPDRRGGLSLEGWERQLGRSGAASAGPVIRAWADTQARYDLPQWVVDELLAGIRMDLSIDRYETFDQLWLYCYRVASTVGLLSMRIIGYEPGADDYAIKLGVALQLTNILRDVGEDARRGRIYLPLDELAEHGIAEQEILDGVCGRRYRDLMRFQIARAHRLYDEAIPGIAYLDPDGRFAVATAAGVYRDILGRIERNNFDNYRFRAYVPAWRKVALLPRIWWSVR